jgi:hypothetical protein
VEPFFREYDHPGRKRVCLEDYDYTMGNLGVSLLFPEIERDMEIRVIVVVHSDPVDKSFPWCQPADELGDGLHVS